MGLNTPHLRRRLCLDAVLKSSRNPLVDRKEVITEGEIEWNVLVHCLLLSKVDELKQCVSDERAFNGETTSDVS